MWLVLQYSLVMARVQTTCHWLIIITLVIHTGWTLLCAFCLDSQALPYFLLPLPRPFTSKVQEMRDIQKTWCLVACNPCVSVESSGLVDCGVFLREHVITFKNWDVFDVRKITNTCISVCQLPVVFINVQMLCVVVNIDQLTYQSCSIALNIKLYTGNNDGGSFILYCYCDISRSHVAIL